MLTVLSVDEDLEEKCSQAVDEIIENENLAHGEKRQLEIAMALATKPKLLLLDEPMAGMGAEESRHLITLLHELRSDFSMLLVEHDMDAVFALADKITVLVYGKSIAEGKPSEIKVNNSVLEAYLGSPGN